MLGIFFVVHAYATDPVYINRGTIVTPPMVDATVFINEGIIDVTTTFLSPESLFATFSTLFYTNTFNAQMGGIPGFDFSFITNTPARPTQIKKKKKKKQKITWYPQRMWSDTFHNAGLIVTADVLPPPFNAQFPSVSGSRIMISATNVVNEGILDVGARGLIKIEGENVDLTRGGIRTDLPFGNQGIDFISGDPNAFFPPPLVSDIYWGTGINQVMAGDDEFPLFLPGGFTEPNTRTPSHHVAQRGFGGLQFVSLPRLSFEGFEAFAFTNRFNATGAVVQVVFVATNSFEPELKHAVRFAPGNDPRTPGHSAIVEFQIAGHDIVYDQPMTNYFYIMDHLAWTNAFRLMVNNIDGTQRPSNYELFRETPFEWDFAQFPNRDFTEDMIWNPAYTNRVVTNRYAAYSAQVGNQQTTSFFVPVSSTNPSLTDPTNKPGRVEITATNLDLSQVRIRGEGLVTINSPNVTGTPEALDASLISLDLGSFSGDLLISNVAPVSVKRIFGELACYSARWTNVLEEITGAGTNELHVKFHVLVVDQNFGTEVPVVVRDLILRSENVTVEDTLNVSRHFQVEAEHLTINGGISYPTNATPRELSTLLTFTNHGIFSYNGFGEFGRFVPPTGKKKKKKNIVPDPILDAFVNSGTIDGQTLYVRSHYIENSGFISASVGPILFDTSVANLSDGNIYLLADFRIDAAEVYTANSTFQAGDYLTNFFTGQVQIFPGAIDLTVSGILSDLGPDAGIGRWTVLNGVRLNIKPTFGDLLATRIHSIIPRFRNVNHVWAAEDRGPVPSGYMDNVAVGHFILDMERAGSRVSFSGVGGANALYIDYLEFRNVAASDTFYLNLDGSFHIASDMMIYFADSNLPPEKLNERPDGRLRWVPGYAGINSSTNITYPNGRTYTFNTALVRSSDLDSDGDGIANSQDPTPIPVQD